MQTLVLGSSGFLGVHVVGSLVGRGLSPRCGRRARSNGLALRRLVGRRDRVLADLDDPASLRAAMEGVEVVFHCAGHYPTRSADAETTLVTGRQHIDTVCDVAAEQGVRRLVYLSSTGSVAPGNGMSTEDDTFAERPTQSLYHALKWEMEARVLAEDRFETSIACPGACLGPWDLRVGTSALLVAAARGIDVPHPDGWIGVVDARDVGEAMVRMAERPEPISRLLLVGHNRRLQALLQELSQRYGTPPPSAPLSPQRAIAVANAAESAPGRPAISRAIVDLIVHGVPVDNRRSRELLPIHYRPLAATLDDWDAWAGRLGIIPNEPERVPA